MKDDFDLVSAMPARLARHKLIAFCRMASIGKPLPSGSFDRRRWLPVRVGKHHWDDQQLSGFRPLLQMLKP